MSRSASRTQNSVSLFPFLAVLVCAMGALIFLLLVTTRRIRDDARRAAVVTVPAAIVAPLPQIVDEPIVDVRPDWTRPPLPIVPPPLPEPVPEPEPEPAPPVVVRVPVPLPDPNVELRRTIAALETQLAERSELVTRAARATSTSSENLASLQAAAAQSSNELDAKRRQLAALVQQSAALQAKRAAADKDAEALVERLRRAKAKPVDEESKFAFVPFDGTTGTTRRPIYVECTAEGLRYLPEDVLLSEADLVGFTLNFNPLLTGTRSLVAHWTATDRRDDPAGDSPYVLLLVRPDGAAAYYAARTLLARIGTPTGYEIVPDDLEIAMPEADPIARALLVEDKQRMLAERDRAELQARTLATLGNGGGPRGGGIGDDGIGSFGGPGDSPFGERANGTEENPTGDARRPVGIGGAPHVGIGARPVGIGGLPEASPLGGNQRPIVPSVREYPPARDRTLAEAGRADNASRDSLDNPASGGGAPPSLTSIPFATDTPPSRSAQPYEGGLLDTKAERTDDVFPKQDDEPSPFDGPRPDDVFDRATHGHPSSAGGHAAVSRSGIGFEKPVLVEVTGDRMIIGERYTLPFERGQRAEDLVNSLMQGVDGVVAGWGRPPRGFHWVPSVKFRVSPGGNVAYERIRSRMEKTGLRTSVEYTLEANNDARKP